MKIGEKIKVLRLKRGLTQKELASDFMTRNMLSQIENGNACPSYASIKHLSRTLSVSPSYFFTEEDDLETFELSREMPEIRQLYQQKRYKEVLDMALNYEGISLEEINMMVCDSYYHLGLEAFNQNRFDEALSSFEMAEVFHEKFSLPLNCVSRIQFYKNVISTLMKTGHYTGISFVSTFQNDDSYVDFVVYSYLMSMLDSDQSDKAAMLYDSVRIKNNLYRTHFNARLAASHFNYERARELLLEITKHENEVPLPILLNVYDDLERYCKALEDYEGAYRCLVAKQKLQ